MATPADNEDPENLGESEVSFAFQTPFGIFTDPDDLPPAVRELLEQNLATLPPEMRAILAMVLDLDASGATSAAHGEADHRELVWAILDAAFPDDPHLWQAGQALFTLSASNPAEIDDETRRDAIETATLHLQRRAGQIATPQGSTEQLVTKFREQMDDL